MVPQGNTQVALPLKYTETIFKDHLSLIPSITVSHMLHKDTNLILLHNEQENCPQLSLLWLSPSVILPSCYDLCFNQKHPPFATEIL
jgi:hypothetical protein